MAIPHTLSTQNSLSRWASGTIGKAHVAMLCNDFELIRQGVASGLGIGFLPADSVAQDDGVVALAVHSTQPEVLQENLYLVMHEDVRRSLKVRTVADFLTTALADH